MWYQTWQVYPIYSFISLKLFLRFLLVKEFSFRLKQYISERTSNFCLFSNVIYVLHPHKFSEFEMLKKSWQKAPKDKNLSGFESKNEKY